MKVKTKSKEKFSVKGSPHGGFGLFANMELKKGDEILEYRGPIITDEQANKKLGMYIFALDHGLNIDGSGRSNKARYINHSCRPNAEAYKVGKKQVFIYAMKKILPGEEITYDYGREFFEGHIIERGCLCGHCNGKGKLKKKK